MTSKMYIAVLDEVNDYMVPTLVAHTILNAHNFFTGVNCPEPDRNTYNNWYHNSFRKVVLRVNRKEFIKIQETIPCWGGYENTTLDGTTSCLVVLPVDRENVPNVLKFAKLWSPKED